MAAIRGVHFRVMRNFCGWHFSGRQLLTTRLLWKRPLTNTVEANSSTTESSETSKTTSSTSGCDGDTAAAQETVQTLEQEKKNLLMQFDEIQDKYKRSLAETENVRQRLQKQIEDAKLFGVQGFCKDLLEVADILEKATDSIEKNEAAATNMPPNEVIQSLRLLHEGLRLTESQLLKVFARHGLAKISPAEGEKFDPNYHEALFQQPLATGKTAGTVAVVSKVGYKLHNRTLRPALVGVFGSN